MQSIQDSTRILLTHCANEILKQTKIIVMLDYAACFAKRNNFLFLVERGNDFNSVCFLLLIGIKLCLTSKSPIRHTINTVLLYTLCCF